MKQRLAAILLTCLPAMSWGSTDEAWAEFRTAVDQSCRALIEAPSSASVVVEINPFGSESHGAALVTVEYETGRDRMICIYDKGAGTAEITAPFADAVPVR